MAMNKSDACLTGSTSGTCSNLDAAVALFHSLSDPARLATVRRLADGAARAVDLTGELVNMITAQRVYQANAQTIKAQDQLLQTIVNLR
mgnify:CR=1 FL=1